VRPPAPFASVAEHRLGALEVSRRRRPRNPFPEEGAISMLAPVISGRSSSASVVGHAAGRGGVTQARQVLEPRTPLGASTEVSGGVDVAPAASDAGRHRPSPRLVLHAPRTMGHLEVWGTHDPREHGGAAAEAGHLSGRILDRVGAGTHPRPERRGVEVPGRGGGAVSACDSAHRARPQANRRSSTASPTRTPISRAPPRAPMTHRGTPDDPRSGMAVPPHLGTAPRP
jgi:hypothetical protein